MKRPIVKGDVSGQTVSFSVADHNSVCGYMVFLETENARLTDRLDVVTAENEAWQAQARRIASGEDPDWERDELSEASIG